MMILNLELCGFWSSSVT